LQNDGDAYLAAEKRAVNDSVPAQSTHKSGTAFVQKMVGGQHKKIQKRKCPGDWEGAGAQWRMIRNKLAAPR